VFNEKLFFVRAKVSLLFGKIAWTELYAGGTNSRTKCKCRHNSYCAQHMAQREIIAAANEYLALHRAELIAEASEAVERWMRKASSVSALSVQHLRDLHRTRRPNSSALSLCKCDERNEAPKEPQDIGRTNPNDCGICPR
jgi:hypothetical protein